MASGRRLGYSTRRRTTCPFCLYRQSKEFVCKSCVEHGVKELRAELSKCLEVHEGLRSEISNMLRPTVGRGIGHLSLRQEIRENLDFSIAFEIHQVEERKKNIRERRARIKKAWDKLVERKAELRRIRDEINEKQNNILKHSYKKLAGEFKRKIEILLSLYPIRPKDAQSCTIVGVPLPDQTNFLEMRPSSFDKFSSALGYTVLVTQMIARYLCVPLPHEMVFMGSTSYVMDACFPNKKLHFASSDPAELKKAVRVLAMNIMDLCSQACVPEQQISRYKLLPNLLNLIQLVSLGRVFQSRNSHSHITRIPPAAPSPARTPTRAHSEHPSSIFSLGGAENLVMPGLYDLKKRFMFGPSATTRDSKRHPDVQSNNQGWMRRLSGGSNNSRTTASVAVTDAGDDDWAFVDIGGGPKPHQQQSGGKPRKWYEHR